MGRAARAFQSVPHMLRRYHRSLMSLRRSEPANHEGDLHHHPPLAQESHHWGGGGEDRGAMVSAAGSRSVHRFATSWCFGEAPICRAAARHADPGPARRRPPRRLLRPGRAMELLTGIDGVSSLPPRRRCCVLADETVDRFRQALRLSGRCGCWGVACHSHASHAALEHRTLPQRL
jgi:hypothetical protein